MEIQQNSAYADDIMVSVELPPEQLPPGGGLAMPTPPQAPPPEAPPGACLMPWKAEDSAVENEAARTAVESEGEVENEDAVESEDELALASEPDWSA